MNKPNVKVFFLFSSCHCILRIFPETSVRFDGGQTVALTSNGDFVREASPNDISLGLGLTSKC